MPQAPVGGRSGRTPGAWGAVAAPVRPTSEPAEPSRPPFYRPTAWHAPPSAGVGYGAGIVEHPCRHWAAVAANEAWWRSRQAAQRPAERSGPPRRLRPFSSGGWPARPEQLRTLSGWHQPTHASATGSGSRSAIRRAELRAIATQELSTTTCSPTAPTTRSPSPEAVRTARTTAARSNRRTGRSCVRQSATPAMTPTPSWRSSPRCTATCDC